MLELKIIDGLRPEYPTPSTKVFNAEGGTIGRDPNCDWVLFDRQKVISGRHAKIIYSQDHYYLSDLSINGILNAAGQPISKGELRKLNQGDIYLIGPYRIEVSGIKTQDHALNFKEAGLEHILSKDTPEKDAITPLDYAHKSNLTPTPTSTFEAVKHTDTLKAYDFMPEPIDLILTGATKEVAAAKTSTRPCIPEDIFPLPSAPETLPEPATGGGTNMPLEKEAADSATALLQPANPRVIKEAQIEVAHSENSTEAEAKHVSPDLKAIPDQTDAITYLCQFFNLDTRLFGGVDSKILLHKLMLLLQGLLELVFNLRKTEADLATKLGLKTGVSTTQHNPFAVAVSLRQLLELVLRDDPEFMELSTALNEINTHWQERLQQLPDAIHYAAAQMLAELAPEVIYPQTKSTFGPLYSRQAWKAYQERYHAWSEQDAELWQQQFQAFIQLKLKAQGA